MINGIAYLLAGALLVWVGWRSWKYRKRETISAIEAAILRATNEEPLPPTKFDWAQKHFQAVMGFTLGPLFAVLGLVIIFDELGIL